MQKAEDSDDLVNCGEEKSEELATLKKISIVAQHYKKKLSSTVKFRTTGGNKYFCLLRCHFLLLSIISWITLSRGISFSTKRTSM